MPLKVLHVIPTYFPASIYGGPMRSTHQMNQALAAQGANVRVLTTDSNGRERLAESGRVVEYGQGLSAEYARRTWMPDVSLGLLRRLPAGLRWTDVVHLTAVYSFPTIPTLLLARFYGRPVFWSPRGALQEWHASPKQLRKKLWDAVCKAVAGKNTTIVAASEREAEAAKKRFPRMRVVQVANGVMIPESRGRRRGEGGPHLLFLGRLHPIKAIENLLRAFARVITYIEGVRLTVAGPGESDYLETLKTEVERLGIEKSVAFTGAVDDTQKEKLFAESDVLVLASHSENFGLVVAEALAHGVPVVVTQHAPWAGVEEKRCGRWVPNDPESLASAIHKLLQSDLAAMGERGREWMRSDFAWGQKAAQLYQYYLEATTPKAS